MEVIKANEDILGENRKWRKDIDAMAMVTSCMAEYLAMQTAVDKQAFNARQNLLGDIDRRFRDQIPERPPANMTTSRVDENVSDVTPMQAVHH